MKPTMPFSLASSIGSKSNSFSEKRSRDDSDRYNKALKEQKKMVRAQYAVSDNSLKEVFKIKSNLLDRKIRRMEDAMKDNGSR